MPKTAFFHNSPKWCFFFHGDLAWDRMRYKKIAEETNPSCWFYTKLCILLFLQTMMMSHITCIRVFRSRRSFFFLSYQSYSRTIPHGSIVLLLFFVCCYYVCWLLFVEIVVNMLFVGCSLVNLSMFLEVPGTFFRYKATIHLPHHKPRFYRDKKIQPFPPWEFSR